MNVSAAIGKRHVELVQASLDNDNADRVIGDGLTALMRAAMIGHTEAVQALLDRGVDANARDEDGRTALLEAAFGGHLDTLKLLLERRADVNACDHDGWTPLMEAASKGHTEAVRELLEAGAEVNSRNRNGWTALRAAARGHFEITTLLKAAGGTL
jgi:ankyrin repeat protein